MTGSGGTGRPACRWRCGSSRPRGTWTTCGWRPRPPGHPAARRTGPRRPIRCTRPARPRAPARRRRSTCPARRTGDGTAARCSWIRMCIRRWRRSRGSWAGRGTAGRGTAGRGTAGRGTAGGGPGGPGREELAGFADETIALLERAQQDDGYLNSYFQVSGEPRYSRLAWSHEMYCAGHLIQAAVALNRSVPGSGLAGRLLAVARRVADHLAATFGGRERGLDGHPEIETALAELYRETGHRRYLQDWRPARDTVTLEGHAVRALYLEAGLTDVAAETSDPGLLASSLTRWADMTAAKTALTGGTGSRHADEAFGDHYELPPDRAYNETCAAIAALHWSWRLLLATGHARYADLAERLLYNAFGAAVSAD